MLRCKRNTYVLYLSFKIFFCNDYVTADGKILVDKRNLVEIMYHDKHDIVKLA